MACPGQQTVWDLDLGTSVSQISGTFADFACGTNGGPPSVALLGFEDYRQCETDERGLHEVYFRYGDEQEFIARALEQQRRLEMCEGTRVYGIPVVASALIDEAGILRGLRLVSDPRGVDPGDRNDHWALGAMLQRRFDGDWECTPLPLAAGGTNAATYLPNRECILSTDTVEITVRQEYFHRTGHAFSDEFGVVNPDLFVSTTYFEMLQNAGAER